MSEDVALEFARQILGWPNAYRVYNKVYSYERQPREPRPNIFHQYDIRKLLKLVAWYCNKVGARVDLNCLYADKPAEALIRECLALKKLLETK